jgi:DNA repair photolyase
MTNMEIYKTTLRTGITRTKEFEKKKLAQFAVNVGTRCGHQCLYCSTPALLRMHGSFKQVGKSPFDRGYAIIDPSTPERVARDAARIRRRGMVQLCTTVDAWSPEAKKYDLGLKCLEAILSQPGWTVRILTKSAAVLEDFDLIEKHKNRVLVGTSVTATPDKQDVMSIIEPYASSIQDRMNVLQQAHARGFRTYGMFCPLLPGISDSTKHVDCLVRFASEIGAEEIFVEPVNPRGRGLMLMQEALQAKGFRFEAAHIEAIRTKENWSWYATRLIRNVQSAARRLHDIRKLRLLLYPSRLEPQDGARIEQDDAGVVWLGKG